MTFKEDLNERIKFVNVMLEKYLPQASGSVTAEACVYSVEAGGKRLRPIFLLAVYESFAGKNSEHFETAQCFAAALEFIHTYSLVHDDLPDMDNDMYRRGKLTTHAKFGPAMGILTGDALLNEAFTMTAKELAKLAADETVSRDFLLRAAKAQSVLAEYAGKDGMILGQEIDLKSEGKSLSGDKLMCMYELKTSRLLQIAFKTGAILGGATEAEVKAAEKAALNLGLAFQVQDDILDVIGDESKLGKPVLSDEKNDKKTSVSLFGIEGAKKMSEEYTETAIKALESLPGDITFVRELMQSLLEREF